MRRENVPDRKQGRGETQGGEARGKRESGREWGREGKYAREGEGERDGGGSGKRAESVEETTYGRFSGGGGGGGMASGVLTTVYGVEVDEDGAYGA